MGVEEKTKKSKRLTGVITIIVIVLAIVWFSGVLPPQVAEIVATNYMSKQEDGNEYKISGSDYSSAHDCYFVYFTNKASSEQRTIGIYDRYFPFHVYFDSDYPG